MGRNESERNRRKGETKPTNTPDTKREQHKNKNIKNIPIIFAVLLIVLMVVSSDIKLIEATRHGTTTTTLREPPTTTTTLREPPTEPPIKETREIVRENVRRDIVYGTGIFER